VVDDLAAAVAAVRDHGGQAGEPQQQPYGRIAECIDDQGTHFQLLQP
jgi:predicted enzyme related to lactoylglutathione lyase